jgi:hypothetical protein
MVERIEQCLLKLDIASLTGRPYGGSNVNREFSSNDDK